MKELCLFLSTPVDTSPTIHINEVAMQIARFPKENGSRARTVVITQGKDPTVIAFNGKVRGPCREEWACQAALSASSTATGAH